MSRVAHAAVAVVLASVGLGCTSPPTILPSRDLDRPADVTFVCMGAFEPSSPASDPDAGTGNDGADASDAGAPNAGLVLSGQPMRACHPRTRFDPPADAKHRTFAFLPNSSSGQLAVVDADHWKLIDLDLANAGYNQVPLGVLPSQIAASDDGCRLVTANHGSCDLSLVDPAALMTPTLAREIPGLTPTGASPVTSVRPQTRAGVKLEVFAQEVAFLPQRTSEPLDGKNLCGGTSSWRALVTFPSCDLVALVDLPTGTIVDGAYVRRLSATDVSIDPLNGRDPVCPISDCRPSASPPGALDAGDASQPSPDAAGGSASNVTSGPPAAPGAIAIIPETGRAFVGLANVSAVVSFDVTSEHLSNGGKIALHEDAIGASRLRLSIDPYAEKIAGSGLAGRFVGNDTDQTNAPTLPNLQDRQYLYAIARDGTTRVVQVAQPGQETECETNVDPQQPLGPGLTRDQACIPVDLLGRGYGRRPTALGPGIRLPAPAIDVAVVDTRPATVDHSETSVEGAHAWILTATGAVYLVNINPVPRFTLFVEDPSSADPSPVKQCKTPMDQCRSEDPPPPNTLRNSNVNSYSLSLDPSAGPPRVDIPPTAAAIGPRIESIWTSGTANNATALSAAYQKTPVFFPEPTSVTPQTWTVTWEGSLLAGPRLSGKIELDAAGTKASLRDFGVDFCHVGIANDDLVTIFGCVDDTQCGLGKTCLHGTDGTQAAGGLPINGLCVDKVAPPTTVCAPGSSVASCMPAKRCERLLSTIRRYDVTRAQPNQLGLSPHKDELVRPNLTPCVVTLPNNDGGADGGTSADANADAGVADASAADAAAADAGASDAAGDAHTTTDGHAADGSTIPIPPSTCINPADPTTASFQCLAGRCLMPCTTAQSTAGCRPGRVCVSYGASFDSCADKQCFCADGPDLSADNENLSSCLGEFLAYQLSVGRGFLVEGSQTGLQQTEVSAPDPSAPGQLVCVPDPNRDPRTNMRIPMNAELCNTLPADPIQDSRCNPDALGPDCQPGGALQLLSILKDPNTPKSGPCLFVGGPNDNDVAHVPPQKHVHALFRNNQLKFMMTNLEQSPSGTFQIRFDVHGGFRPQVVATPGTVEVTMPTRLVVGPVDTQAQSGTDPGRDVPYLFVVDQRRLGRTQGGGPTRGQLLRIHPLGFTVSVPVPGVQPWYEDFTHSGNLFPIQ